MRNLKIVQSHTAGKWQNWDVNLGVLDTQAHEVLDHYIIVWCCPAGKSTVLVLD